MTRTTPFWVIAFWLLVTAVHGHELRPAYLEMRETGEETCDVVWKVPARSPTMRLGLYVRFPTDCSTLSSPRSSYLEGAIIERSSIHRPGGIAGIEITIDGLRKTLTDVLVRVEKLNGASYSALIKPTHPVYVIPDETAGTGLAATYTYLGFEHILLGVDHLLFILGLLLIVKRRWMLVKTITSFTIAHSITLAIATLGFARAPLPPLNVAIALSILFLGPEIVRSWRGQTSFTLAHPWVVAFAFGLLHGFGFASGLTTLGMATADIPLCLLWFNVGVEFGQLTFVFLCLGMVRAFDVLAMRWPLAIARLPGYTVGVCGAFWTLQRTVMMVTGP